MQRRELIQWMLATGGLAAFNRLSAADLESIGRNVHARETVQLRALTPRVARTVTAASERIIPRSETPGATDAGTTAFIDTMMSDWYAPAERDRFLAGINELDVRSRATSGKDFVDIPAAEQIALLTEFDNVVTALRRERGGAIANAHWFAALKYLTVWGYCTSEKGMRETLRSWPPPMRYEGCAPVEPRRTPTRGTGR
jgi:hypothetical protein